MNNSADNLEAKELIEKMRHTCAHVLAQAVLKFYPDTKLGIGPAIDDGFYYDFEFSQPVTDEDLIKFEEEMKAIIEARLPLTQEFRDRAEVIELFKNNNQEYKLDLLEGIPDEKLSFYITGDHQFVDLCRGPHIANTGMIGAIKLTKMSGAYWKGDEKNKMLTRIYGLAFNTQEELEEHVKMLEEAKERDHRKLGKELGLFVFSDDVGKGLPLWTPKGAAIRRELERFIVDEEIKRGYLHVYTPDIANLKLYEKSGHYPYYKDSMYAPITIDEDQYMLRPMTCPHHFELYLSEPRSYRELPMRIAELAQLYRYEQTGELTGLMRVRTFCLADAHIVCASPEQAKTEIQGALDLIEYIADVLGLSMGKNYSYRLSLGDRSDTKKYFKNDQAWDQAEQIMREVLNARDCQYYEAPGEAAFYGPKIDIQMKNIMGKEDTAFTVQYDFVMPGRFNLKYTDSDGQEKDCLVVHRSSIGAIERIMAFLIEYYGGAFPLWLSPEQVRVVPISSKHLDYANKIYNTYKASGLKVTVDERNETLQYKIRDAQMQKINYVLVVGDKEVDTETVAIRSRQHKDMGLMRIDEFLEKAKEEIRNKGKNIKAEEKVEESK